MHGDQKAVAATRCDRVTRDYVIRSGFPTLRLVASEEIGAELDFNHVSFNNERNEKVNLMADVHHVEPPDPESGRPDAPSNPQKSTPPPVEKGTSPAARRAGCQLPSVVLDSRAIGAHFGPGGWWARRCGDFVRRRRVELGVSAIDLARHCGIGPPTLYKVETGAMIPSDRVRVAIAYQLGVQPEAIWSFPSRNELELVSAAGIPATDAGATSPTSPPGKAVEASRGASAAAPDRPAR